MKLYDVATMNPNPSEGNQSSGNFCISKCLVYFGEPHNAIRGWVPSVNCIVHGEMIAVSKLTQGGMLYRCEACNNGAITK